MSQGRQGATNKRGPRLRKEVEAHELIETMHSTLDRLHEQVVALRRALVDLEANLHPRRL